MGQGQPTEGGLAADEVGGALVATYTFGSGGFCGAVLLCGLALMFSIRRSTSSSRF